jgi:hypothetical protein
MTAIETFAQREKRELDVRLDEELEGTFPASDPPKITCFSAKSRLSDRQRRIAPTPKSEKSLKQAAADPNATSNHLDDRPLCRG